MADAVRANDARITKDESFPGLIFGSRHGKYLPSEAGSVRMMSL